MQYFALVFFMQSSLCSDEKFKQKWLPVSTFIQVGGNKIVKIVIIFLL